ncbi:hypothetical protein F6Q07_21815 [Pectobacterium parmentieri]|nr:hypothetical protein C5E22_19865 [Pectobacterium parmentieri]MBI0520719.1 hypothetical protein [Pectobacterium parmentieri]
MTDAEGAVRWSGDYGSFGAVNGQTQDSEGLRHGKPVESQPRRYAGQYADEETGLHRYYDPTVGRFTTQDPIGLAGGINLYQYTPNPLGWVDPLGLNKTPTQLPSKIIYNENSVRVWHNYGNLGAGIGTPKEHAPIHYHVTVGSDKHEYRVFPSGKPLKESKPLPTKAEVVFKENKSRFTNIGKRIGKWFKGCGGR